MIDLDAVNKGFSGKAEVYDAYCASHPVISWARDLIRREVASRITADASILELNAGTGSDAEYFVSQGFRVHATDVADGMLAVTRQRITSLNVDGRLTAQQLSFTELESVSGAPFDLIFSNFGGLNCIPDLQAVTRALPSLLKPHGIVVWVVMPKICPWELAQVLRGHVRVAGRRISPHGTLANVEGAGVMTWYHSPASVRRAFGDSFRLLRRQSISLFSPPSYMDGFPKRYPQLTKFLLGLDERFGAWFPFNRWGDFLMYTFRYEPV